MVPLVLVLVLVLGTTGSARAGDDPDLGETRWVGKAWFQWLGRDEAGQGVWLYPHTDGVPEPLLSPPGDPQAGPWVGLLETRYDPGSGRFTGRWNAAEAINELLDAGSSAPRRAEAARLLSVWLSLHPAPRTPCYARELGPALAAALAPADAAWVGSTRERWRALVGRVATPGTRVLPPPARLLSAHDHYQALVQDGYLDVSVIGGNSYDPQSETRQTWDLLQELGRELGRAGYAPAAFRAAADETLRERTVELLGRRVRVRVQLTGGSGREERTRRGIANLVEGLASADLVVYTGHSNKDAACYWISEQKSESSRFRLGGAAEDLAEKFHLLGRRQHQLLALQSCSSLPKYCRPVAAAWAAGWGEATLPGFLGTTELAWFDEFVPRYRALLLGLAAGAGPRALEAALRAAPRRDDAAPLLLRGVLQPRRTFLLPPGVRIERVEELGPEQGWLVAGQGSDGARYLSSEAVPQDAPGDVVQVVPWERGLLALGRDGRLRRIGPETGGQPLPVAFGLGRDPELRFVARLDRAGRERVGLVDREGRAWLLSGLPPRPAEVRAARRPAAPLCALGLDAAGEVVAIDARGGGHAWRPALRAWEPLPRPPTLSGAAPSLLSPHAPAVLWIGAGEAGRALDLVGPGWEKRPERDPTTTLGAAAR